VRIREWITKLTDRRRGSRFRIESLQAHYWTGAAPHPVDVRDISLYGAYIIATDSFYPATLLQIVLTNQGEAGAHICVCARVQRNTQDGFCVSFLFSDLRQRRLFRQFLARVKRKPADDLQRPDQSNATGPLVVRSPGKDPDASRAEEPQTVVDEDRRPQTW
jgi:hypothetical protein